LTKSINFDQEREDKIQRTVYEKAQTLVENGSHDAREEKPLDTKKESLSLATVLEVYKNDVLVDSFEVNIYENSSVLAAEKVHVVTGSIQRQQSTARLRTDKPAR